MTVCAEIEALLITIHYSNIPSAFICLFTHGKKESSSVLRIEKKQTRAELLRKKELLVVA
jgi:hypothetical protein